MTHYAYNLNTISRNQVARARSLGPSSVDCDIHNIDKLYFIFMSQSLYLNIMSTLKLKDMYMNSYMWGYDSQMNNK